MNTKHVLLAFAGVCVVSTAFGLAYSPQEKQATAAVSTVEGQQQSAIQDKMWNAIDNYKNISGAYKSYSSRLGSNTVEFQVRQGEKPSSYMKTTAQDGRVLEDRVNGKVLMTKVNGQLVEASPVAPVDNKKPNQRYTKLDGKKVYVFRENPAFLNDRVSFPQAEALGYMEDQGKWSIQGEEVLLGRTAVVVGGELEDHYKQKHLAETFKFWVDKDTGILLKAQEYNTEGKIVENMEVTALKVNGPIVEERFHIPHEVEEKAKLKLK